VTPPVAEAFSTSVQDELNTSESYPRWNGVPDQCKEPVPTFLTEHGKRVSTARRVVYVFVDDKGMQWKTQQTKNIYLTSMVTVTNYVMRWFYCHAESLTITADDKLRG
jgi:hypothetical protein